MRYRGYILLILVLVIFWNWLNGLVAVSVLNLSLIWMNMKVVNVKNIRNLSDKIKHSRQLLQSEDTFVHVVESVFVLLSDDNFQQRSNRLRRVMIPKYREIMPMKVEAFYSTYFH